MLVWTVSSFSLLMWRVSPKQWILPSSLLSFSTINLSASSTAIEVGPLFISISAISTPLSPAFSSSSKIYFYISRAVIPISRAIFSIITVLEAASLFSFYSASSPVTTFVAFSTAFWLISVTFWWASRIYCFVRMIHWKPSQKRSGWSSVGSIYYAAC